MADTAPPMVFHWDGEHMVPRQPRLADRYYVVGADYRLVQMEERSANSHNHFFASIADAWQNLPEHLAEQFPSSEHLRKYALIKTGYRDERSIVAASKAEALRLSSFIRPMDEYCIVIVSECVVTVYTARSQSTRAMGKAAFQESKSAVLDLLAGMVGVTGDELKRNAGSAA